MKYKKRPDSISSAEASELSRVKTMFVDASSSQRRPLSSDDTLLNSDIIGMCDYLLAKGHSRRLYGMIGSTTIDN